MLFVAAQAAGEKSSSIVSIEGRNYYVHRVEPGQTVYSLSKLYSIDEEELQTENPQIAEGLQVGQVLKVPVPEQKELKPRAAAKLFEQHIVNQGETAYNICKRYGIGVDMLVEDNPGVDPLVLSIGQTLNIRKNAMYKADEHAVNASMEEYSAAMSELDDSFVYHNVEKGETVYSLTKRYSLSEAEIARYNDIAAGIKIGQILKLPVVGRISQVDVYGYDRPHDNESVVLPPQGNVPDPYEIVGSGVVRDPRADDQINVAMFLPMKKGEDVSSNFVDFYRGALMGFQYVKSQGITTNLSLYNDMRSEAQIESIVGSTDFAATDLIIGPVYESEMEPVMRFATREGVPVVSPLGVVENINSNLLYQIYPLASTKYDKIRTLLSSDNNIIAVYAEHTDVEFERELSPLLPADCKRIDYVRKMSASSIERLLSRDKENVVVFFMSEESEIDEMLARISSIQSSLLARGARAPQIRVVATSRWQRFSNIDKSLYFKLRLTFVTPYYADKDNENVAAFDRQYIDTFGALPSLYAYRGYDVARLFAESYVGSTSGDDFSSDRKLNELGTQLLQTPYRFVHPLVSHTGEMRAAQIQHHENFSRPFGSLTHVNDQWALVLYQDDYTITVE